MMNRIDMKRKLELCLAVVALVIAMSSFARADVVTEWNQNAQQALLTAKTSPVVSTRVLAIMHVAMFDAVNEFDRFRRSCREQSIDCSRHRVGATSRR